MAFNINEFQGAMQFGGARPSLFQVTIANPVDPSGDAKLPFMCRTASLPASTVNQVPVQYFGRTVNFAGARTFAPWNVTIFNDEDFKVRNALEAWSNAINTMEGNLRDFASPASTQYKVDGLVSQFSKTGGVLRTYRMIGIWPTEISQIDLDWSNGDAVEEFNVTFSVDYWLPEGGLTGSGDVNVGIVASVGGFNASVNLG
jgi:hypothetical protein